ncbi:hypothetical protein D5018_15195 [Parashewanella curva]|uniref:DUF4870 domain-containing protein n=1 Tax=Parashewanella curva TaxID=2338552 RepID=A0A3L8PTV6_9GAMM|nr:hypothetical protein [Parashewanella curva]RLV58847.1 hypothetical protein D5018_15195 [Parashewanella curva]
MSTIDPTTPLSSYDSAAKQNALIAYVLMGIGLFTGIFWFVGFIWALIKKSDAENSIFADHYSNIISVFIWGLVFSVIGFITAFFIVGWFILIGVFIWSIFKLVKGVANLTSNKAYNG